MNTDDYVTQCLAHLTNKNTYRLIAEYPAQHIMKRSTNVLANYKQVLISHDRRLFKYLSQLPSHARIPRFYSTPKIHKKFSKFSPLCPLVSQTHSLLTPSVKLIDHILQLIVRLYPDYLHNSSTLSIKLEDLTVPDDAILVTLDVTSLYPLIPQQECLQLIYDELHSKRHLF